MRDKMQKKAQSKINKNIRALNKNLKEDDLWRGRFYVRQVAASWSKFDDGSGGILDARVEIRDLKTGMYKSFIIDNYDIGWHLWTNVNDFIVEDSHVWDNIAKVTQDKTNWDKVKWIPKKEIY